jgi:hypothetical protein
MQAFLCVDHMHQGLAPGIMTDGLLGHGDGMGQAQPRQAGAHEHAGQQPPPGLSTATRTTALPVPLSTVTSENSKCPFWGKTSPVAPMMSIGVRASKRPCVIACCNRA